MKLVKVKLTKFKDTGKYYTEYFGEIDKDAFDEGGTARHDAISKILGTSLWNKEMHVLIENETEKFDPDEWIYRLIPIGIFG